MAGWQVLLLLVLVVGTVGGTVVIFRLRFRPDLHSPVRRTDTAPRPARVALPLSEPSPVTPQPKQPDPVRQRPDPIAEDRPDVFLSTVIGDPESARARPGPASPDHPEPRPPGADRPGSPITTPAVRRPGPDRPASGPDHPNALPEPRPQRPTAPSPHRPEPGPSQPGGPRRPRPPHLEEPAQCTTAVSPPIPSRRPEHPAANPPGPSRHPTRPSGDPPRTSLRRCTAAGAGLPCPTTADPVSPAEPPGLANPAPGEAGSLPDPVDVARSVVFGTPGDRPAPASPADIRSWLAEALNRDLDTTDRGQLDAPGDLVGPLGPHLGSPADDLNRLDPNDLIGIDPANDLAARLRNLFDDLDRGRADDVGRIDPPTRDLDNPWSGGPGR